MLWHLLCLGSNTGKGPQQLQWQHALVSCFLIQSSSRVMTPATAALMREAAASRPTGNERTRDRGTSGRTERFLGSPQNRCNCCSAPAQCSRSSAPQGLHTNFHPLSLIHRLKVSKNRSEPAVRDLHTMSTPITVGQDCHYTLAMIPLACQHARTALQKEGRQRQAL